MNNNAAPSRIVIITGASTGIGKACALHLDRLGFQVYAGVRRQADADTLSREAENHLRPVFIDVTDTAAIGAAVKKIGPALDKRGLAGLINNAGIAVGSPLEFLPVDRLKQQLEVNVVGQIAVTQAFLPWLRQARGRVINMSSISGRVAMPFVGPYAASKFAMEALSDSLRVELKPWGIEVISILPGAIDTPIWDKSVASADVLREEMPPQAEQLYGQMMSSIRRSIVQSGRRGIPAETVASVVARALTARRPKTRYLVGQDAKMANLVIRLLPDRFRDWLILRAT